jgi:Mce-associated membrane protein
MSDSSWPPRVRRSQEADRPRNVEESDEPVAYGTPSTDHAPTSSDEPRTYAPSPAEPGTPESIGAVDHGETRINRRAVRREQRDARREDRLEDDDDGSPEGRKRLLTGLLIGGLVVMTALAAVFFAMWLGGSDVEPEDVATYLDEQRPEIEERARTAVDILINYDATEIEAQRQEMLEVSTGSFRDDYEEFTEGFGDILQETGASSTGAILDEPRISFTSPDQADVIVRTEQIAQTEENPSGRKIEYIMRLGLIDTQGGWKVDNIEILSDELI